MRLREGLMDKLLRVTERPQRQEVSKPGHHYLLSVNGCDFVHWKIRTEPRLLLFLARLHFPSVRRGHYWWADKFPSLPHLPLRRLLMYLFMKRQPAEHRNWHAGFSFLFFPLNFGRLASLCVHAKMRHVQRRKQKINKIQKPVPIFPSSPTTTTGKSSSKWMLNKPVCWIIERLRPGPGSD